MKSSVEITIPVLNEERDLIPGVETVVDFLSKRCDSDIDWSVVIADNGSVDRTAELSLDLVKKYNGLVKYVRVNERGVGRVLRASWGRSKADIIGYFDLDLATDLTHLPEAVYKLIFQGYDIVYGTRLNKDSVIIGRSLKRELISRIFNLILKLYLKVKFSDGMCGFKFLKRSILEDLIKHGAVSEGWFFSTELLAVGEKRGYKIFELPVKWTDSGDSRVRIFLLTVEYLKAMRALKRLEQKA